MLRVESGLILIIGVASCAYPIRKFSSRKIHVNYTAHENFALYSTIQDIVFVGCKFHHFSFSSFFVEYATWWQIANVVFYKIAVWYQNLKLFNNAEESNAMTIMTL